MDGLTAFLTSKNFANFVGMIASLCFTIQYIPQTCLNFRRKSVLGFSTTGIIIKHVGASFLFVNSFLTGENMNVILYGLCGVLQHSVFMVQFSMYPSHENKDILDSIGNKTSANANRKDKYLLWLLFPLVPIITGLYYPYTIFLTNGVKPITQILSFASHVPQLKVCYQLKTTTGVSLSSQHLNLVGGICGLYMCWINPPVSNMTYVIYGFSVLQAATLYMMAMHYDNWMLGGPIPKKDKSVTL